jgi:hypothetical protein|tara:strand:- start:2832 stop:3530 length:699 start_codon:yes stop_codon:yes gene_type:complete
MSKQFIYNPVTQELENVNDPSPLREDPKPALMGDATPEPKINSPAHRRKYPDRYKSGYVKWYDRDKKEKIVDTSNKDRKHVADLVADTETNIKFNSVTGRWEDKFGEPTTVSEAIKDQHEVQKTYDKIYPPSMRKKHEESKVRQKVSKAIPQKEQPFQDNSRTITELEQLAQLRLDDQLLENKFNQIMQSPKDPDMDKGIASVNGAKAFKKTVDFADSKWRLKKRRNNESKI